MKLVGGFNRASFLQQIQRRGTGGARRLHHGLVFGRVFVRLEKYLVKLLADGTGTIAPAEFRHPLFDLQLHLLFLLDRRQRLGYYLGRRLAKTPFAGAPEIMRRLEQPEQRAGLLLQRGLVAEIVAREVGKTKLLLGRKLPGHFQLYGLAYGLRRMDKRGGRRFFELEQYAGGLDLDPLAAFQFDLGRRVSLRYHAAGHELAGFFKQ